MINYYAADSHNVPLTRCPFCDGEPHFVEWTETMLWSCECEQCGAQLGEPNGYSSRLDLCHDWNRRSTDKFKNFDEEIIDGLLENAREAINAEFGYKYDEHDLKKAIEKAYVAGVAVGSSQTKD